MVQKCRSSEVLRMAQLGCGISKDKDLDLDLVAVEGLKRYFAYLLFRYLPVWFKSLSPSTIVFRPHP